MIDPQTERTKVQAGRLETARHEFRQAVQEKERERDEQGGWPDEHGSPLLDAGLSAVLRMNRHDGDCQAFQHTYTASQGEPGIYPHGNRNGEQPCVDAIGTNGRRLLVRDDPDGVYIGGALFTNEQVLKLAGQLDSMVTRRRRRRSYGKDSGGPR